MTRQDREGGAISGDGPDNEFSSTQPTNVSDSRSSAGAERLETRPHDPPSDGPAGPDYIPIRRLELVFGLVYGAGVEVGPFEELLRSQLEDFGYGLEPIRLSGRFPKVLGKEFSEASPNATRHLQDMGDDLRRRAGLSIIGRLAVLLIAQQRRELDGAPERVAWLVRSLRRREEVQFLRRVYGPRFILFGIHAPESQRLSNLVERRRGVSPTTSGPFDAEAIDDIRRDEEDLTKSYGQAMRKAMAEADFVIDARSSKKLETTLPRAIEVIFGNPFVTATREEQAMYQAYAASLRSAEMGRQVGAAIISPVGTLLSVGTNEVPKGGGGLYWYPDDPDGRDFARPVPVDANTEWKRRVAREVLLRLSAPPKQEQVASDDLDGESDAEAEQQGNATEDDSDQWLADPRIRRIGDEVIVEEEQLQAFLALMRGTRFDDLTEFGRAVHAEMDAILNAVRIGVPIRGTTLVCTTFPCHNCMRHLIAAGIRRVRYLFPYVKSLGRELHADALAIDPVDPDAVPANRLILEQFVGVTPRGFAQYFDFSRIERKDNATGRAHRLTDRRDAEPRVTRSDDTWAFGGPALGVALLGDIERQAAAKTAEHLTKHGLNLPGDNI